MSRHVYWWYLRLESIVQAAHSALYCQGTFRLEKGRVSGVTSLQVGADLDVDRAKIKEAGGVVKLIA